MAVQPLESGDPAHVAGYQLRGRLGAGGMGVVYLASGASGQPVAVKVLRPELGDQPDFRARFRREVEAARRVSGKYTAQVIDADPEASPPWLVTVYVPGPSLREAVADSGPLPVRTALPLLIGVAEALAAIHAAGVVHRDLKPSNVLLAADGPRVIDFGIARALEGMALTRTGTRLGSPPYMAPEQARGAPVTSACDVWALGALACFAATGRTPFGDGGGDAAVLYRVMHNDPDLSKCPAELTGVIWACLTKEPSGRPSVAQVIDWCQAEAAALPPAGSWLPPVLAADLASYAVSGPAAEPGPAAAQPGPAAAVQPGLAQDAPTVPPPAGTATVPPLPGTVWAAPGPGEQPPQLGTQPYPAAAAAHPAAGSLPPQRPARRGLSRGVIAAGVAAVVLVGLAVYGIVALSGKGGTTSSNPIAQPSHSVSPTAAVSKRPSASPSPSSTLDQCIIGTWTQTLEQYPDTLGGDPVTFSGGAGVIQVFTPTGVNTLTYNNATYTAHENGNTWTQVDNGTATVNYTTQDGMLLSSDLVQSGTWTLYENGSYNNSGPLSEDIAPDRYTCSATSLQLFAPTGDSIDLVRS